MTFTEERGTGPDHKARNRQYVRSAGTEQIVLFHCSPNKEKVPAQKLALYYWPGGPCPYKQNLLYNLAVSESLYLNRSLACWGD